MLVYLMEIYVVRRPIVLARSHPSSVKSGNERPIARLFRNARFATLDSSNYVRASCHLYFRIRCLAPIESRSRYTPYRRRTQDARQSRRIGKLTRLRLIRFRLHSASRLHALLTVLFSRWRVSLLRFATPFRRCFSFHELLPLHVLALLS